MCNWIKHKNPNSSQHVESMDADNRVHQQSLTGRDDELSPGFIQRVQAGAVGDRARGRVGDKAAVCVQSPRRKQVWRQTAAWV